MGSSYIKLHAELKTPQKIPISNKKNNQKCFLWCHIRHINPVKIHPEIITKKDTELLSNLDYEGIDIPMSKRNSNKIEIAISVNAFYYENKLTSPIPISYPKFENSMDLLLACDGDKCILCPLGICQRF